MTTFVVPLDGSVFATRAIRPACSLAARVERGRVLLVSCVPDDARTTQHELDDLVAQYIDVVDIESRIVDGADTADAIMSIAESEPDGVLCMATRGKGAVRATVLGSVSTQVVQRTPQPLILVGPHCRTTLLPAERGRLLVCSDGSALSDSVVVPAATWCHRFGLEPWFTEAVGPDEDPEPAHRPHPNREVEAAKVRLTELAARFDPPASPVNTEVLHGDPSRSIASFAERLPAALIAIATHGRSGLSRVALGSVATDIVRHAPCPVLVTRPTHGQARHDQ